MNWVNQVLNQHRDGYDKYDNNDVNTLLWPFVVSMYCELHTLVCLHYFILPLPYSNLYKLYTCISYMWQKLPLVNGFT